MASALSAWFYGPAGPVSGGVFFWAPTWKWGISMANVADMKRPVDNLSYPQQIAIAATGLIWSRYSVVINPVNYNLLAVNAFMAFTGLYQLYRKARADYFPAKPETIPQHSSGKLTGT